MLEVQVCTVVELFAKILHCKARHLESDMHTRHPGCHFTVYCRLGAINCENRTFSLFAMLGKLSQKPNLCSSENNCLSSSQIYNKQHKVNQRGFSSWIGSV